MKIWKNIIFRNFEDDEVDGGFWRVLSARGTFMRWKRSKKAIFQNEFRFWKIECICNKYSQRSAQNLALIKLWRKKAQRRSFWKLAGFGRFELLCSGLRENLEKVVQKAGVVFEFWYSEVCKGCARAETGSGMNFCEDFKNKIFFLKKIISEGPPHSG